MRSPNFIDIVGKISDTVSLSVNLSTELIWSINQFKGEVFLPKRNALGTLKYFT